jgi:hypothetical protein
MHYIRTVRIICLLLAVGTALPEAFCEAVKRRFTVADDIGLAHFGDPYSAEAAPVTFSPDGRYFAVDTERGLLNKNRSESTLRVFRTKDVRQFLLDSKITSAPSPIWLISKSTYKDGPIITNIRWLKDSSGVAFLAKTISGTEQLLLADLRTKTVRALTLESQYVTAFDIRDQNDFVYSILSPAIRAKGVAESRATSILGTGRNLYDLMFPEDFSFMSKLYDLSEIWAVVKGRRFQIQDKSSGRPLSLYRQGQQSLAMSPNGRSVLAALAVGTVAPEWETSYQPLLSTDSFRIKAGPQNVHALDGQWYVSEYALVDLATGDVKPLTKAPIGQAAGWWGAALTTDWSSDGKWVVLSNTFLPPDSGGANSQPPRPCVAVFDLMKGHPTCLEHLKGKIQKGYEDGYHYISGVRFDCGASGRVIVEYGAERSKQSTIYLRQADGSWTAGTAANECGTGDRSTDINVKENLNDPPVLVATDNTTRVTRVIFDPNPQLKEIDLGQASVYKWKDRTSREWTGGLYIPPNYVQGQRYPLVVQTHGFSEALFRPDGFFPTANAARELAAVGMIVLQVPDCPSYGLPEEASCNATGYEAAVMQLVSDGLADPARVGIVGFSRTCYYVLEMLVTSTLDLKAASITDGVNFGYLQYIANVDTYGNGFARQMNTMIGAPPFGAGLQKWLKLSPEFNMDKIRAPLQIVVTGRPKLINMWEPYAALRYLNKPVSLVLLAEGPHVLSNPAERMASQGGTVDWFRFWLKSEEDPDPAKAEQYTGWHELRKLQAENDAKDKAAKQPAPLN